MQSLCGGSGYRQLFQSGGGPELHALRREPTGDGAGEGARLSAVPPEYQGRKPDGERTSAAACHPQVPAAGGPHFRAVGGDERPAHRQRQHRGLFQHRHPLAAGGDRRVPAGLPADTCEPAGGYLAGGGPVAGRSHGGYRLPQLSGGHALRLDTPGGGPHAGPAAKGPPACPRQSLSTGQLRRGPVHHACQGLRRRPDGPVPPDGYRAQRAVHHAGEPLRHVHGRAGAGYERHE